MDRKTMNEAAAEARRFLGRVKEVEEMLRTEQVADWPITGTVETAAVRRSSLDLTRALARMRRP